MSGGDATPRQLALHLSINCFGGQPVGTFPEPDPDPEPLPWPEPDPDPLPDTDALPDPIPPYPLPDPMLTGSSQLIICITMVKLQNKRDQIQIYMLSGYFKEGALI